MPFQFGTVFSQAMQNAMAAENQKKKDVFDYNMNVDKLNLDKWNSYNSLNLDAYRANQEGKRWGEEMKLKVDDTNWQRQFDTRKFNTDLDLIKEKDFFTASPEMKQGYENTFGVAYPDNPGINTGGRTSYNWLKDFANPLGNSNLSKAMQREQNETTKWVAGLQASTQTTIAQMNNDAEIKMRGLITQEEKDRYQRELDNTAANMIMVYVDEKGDVLQRGYPLNWKAMNELKAQGYILESDYNKTTYNSLKTMPGAPKKTTYPGTKKAITNAFSGRADN
jgi:hypothetical protein